jgi:hypothetical protein
VYNQAVSGALSFAGAAPTFSASRSLTGALSFIGGAQLYPDPNLYPSPDEYPFGGAILFQLNRLLPGVLQPSGAFATHGGLTRSLSAVLQPQAAFLKSSSRVFLAASFTAAAFTAQRVSHTLTQALFASLRNAGSLQTGINPGFLPEGGGGFGVPMPDDHFQRYKPTLRRQRMRV